MQIKYALSKEDLLHFYSYSIAKRFRMPCGLACAGGVVLAVIGFLGAIGYSRANGVSNFSDEFLFSGLAFWGTTIAWSCSVPRLKVVVQNKVQKIPGLLTDTVVDIDPQWLVASSAYGEGRLKWQGVYQVTSDARYIYIVTGDLTRIIPKSSFVSAVEAQSFLEAATGYWQMAKQMPLETQEGVWPPAPRLTDERDGAAEKSIIP